MNIVIPMAGAGSRFAKAGYKTHKPAILTTDRKTGEKRPMVVLAAQDLPYVDMAKNLIFIDRDFHKADGVEKEIAKYFPKARFITIESLTQGQAATCLLAKKYIDNDEELLIAACDNAMTYDIRMFDEVRKTCDAAVFTYRGNPAVLADPSAYGWCVTDEGNNITNVSVKKQISENPMQDHAIVAAFWYKKGGDFIMSAEKMIAENDRINGEFYADQAVNHSIKLGLKAKIFEIDRYICWGTPEEYENYESTLAYWKRFAETIKTKPNREV